MNRQKYSPFSRFLIRTLFLALSLFGALLLVSGMLLLCENPMAYAGVGAVCALLLVGFVYGLLCSREEGFLLSLLSPLCLSLIMLILGIVITKGHLSLSPLLNHIFFLTSTALGRSLPRQKRRKHR